MVWICWASKSWKKCDRAKSSVSLDLCSLLHLLKIRQHIGVPLGTIKNRHQQDGDDRKAKVVARLLGVSALERIRLLPNEHVGDVLEGNRSLVYG